MQDRAVRGPASDNQEAQQKRDSHPETGGREIEGELGVGEGEEVGGEGQEGDEDRKAADGEDGGLFEHGRVERGGRGESD